MISSLTWQSVTLPSSARLMAPPFLEARLERKPLEKNKDQTRHSLQAN